MRLSCVVTNYVVAALCMGYLLFSDCTLPHRLFGFWRFVEKTQSL